jgi:signal transduction histidine kinase/ActR/RegA family two-component response regulator
MTCSTQYLPALLGSARFRQWLLVGCLVSVLIVPGVAVAQMKELRALDSIQALSYRDPARALKELAETAALYEDSPHYEVRRAYLIALIGAEFDGGSTARVDEAIGKLKDMSSSRRDDLGWVMAVTASAHQLATQGKTEEALTLAKSAEAAALRSGDPEALWAFHLVLGSLQATVGEFGPALTNILKSMDFAKARPRQSDASLLRAQVQLTLVYMTMKNAEMALKAIDDALGNATKLEAGMLQGVLSLNRGNVLSGLGQTDAAREAYLEALGAARRSGSSRLQAAALNNLGDIHLIRKEYVQAEAIERSALAKYLEAGDGGGAALSRANVGFSLMGQGRVEEGVTEVKSGLRFLREAGMRATEEIILEELSRMYEQAGMFREAVETMRDQQTLSKDLFRVDREQTVAKLQAQFDSVQRERKIEALAKENRQKDADIHNRRLLQMATVIGTALTVVAGVYILFLYRRARQSNLAMHEARVLAEDALSEKNMFLATASHDLRQPIHAMSMLVEAIGLRNKDYTLASMLMELKNGMGSMSQLFNSLLDLSRLEAGTKSSHPVQVDLALVLGDLAKQFRAQASMAGLDLRVRLPKCAAHVLADPDLLRQALVNLTQNAIRYTQQGGILLSARRRGDQWQIEVWDSGIGISAQDDHRVFSPYFRGEGAWHVDSSGHGLGLAVVARCAKLLDATYGFRSRVGRGSRFWLRLAAVARRVEAGAELTPQSTKPEGSGFKRLSGRCLVLDDDTQVISAWKAMLESWGIEGRVATTSAEAFGHIDAGFRPDAVFCDQQLRSSESGFKVLKALLLRCPNASGAMISGEFNSAELAQAEDEGYLVFTKPLDLGALHAVLENWLDPAESSSILADGCR